MKLAGNKYIFESGFKDWRRVQDKNKMRNKPPRSCGCVRMNKSNVGDIIMKSIIKNNTSLAVALQAEKEKARQATVVVLELISRQRGQIFCYASSQ